MSLQLKIREFTGLSDTGKKTKYWGAKVTLTSPKMDDWVTGRTKEEALKNLDKKLMKLEMNLNSKAHRVLACRAMVFRSAVTDTSIDASPVLKNTLQSAPEGVNYVRDDITGRVYFWLGDLGQAPER